LVLVVGLVIVVVVRSGDDLPRSEPLSESELLVGAGASEGAVRLWRVDVTGNTPAEPLSAGGSVERLPVLGPDRDTVVYQRQRSQGTYDAWAARAEDGGGEVALFEKLPDACQGSNGRPAWVPGTTEFILRCLSRGTNESRTLSLLQLDRSGNVKKSYAVRVGGETFDGIGDPTVSPDGSTLVVYAADDRDDLEGSLFAIDIESGVATLLLEAVGEMTYSDPVFSPRDNRLAWRVALPSGSGGWEVQTAILGKGGLGPVQSISGGLIGNDRDPTFSPDGTQVAFIHVISKTFQQLYLADLSDTPDPRALTIPGLPSFQSVPTWTRR
jgi:Tol biopolymer transport system component